MAIRTVLTLVGIDGSDSDLKAAISVCEEVGAHLSVLIAGLAPTPPMSEFASGAIVATGWIEQRQEDEAKLRHSTASVTELLATSGISADIDSVYAEAGWIADEIGRRARYADVTLLGAEFLGHDILKSYALNGALFDSGTPVLLTPAGSRPTLQPRRILVAWDSKIEAARAVREALEMLADADEVHVTLVDPDSSELKNGAEPGADIAAYLARHGVKVTVDRLPSQGQSVADVLRRHAVDTAAEMIVMGGYGHSRLRERIFGGVTRSLINNPPLPLFMAR
ncbi:MAG: universal stress protein [Mesorhizobium sp.]|nr:universal stress protein [Mesorhizobium sp.]